MKKLDYGKTFLLGFGFFAISIMWSVYNAFIPKILDNFITSTTLIGFIMTVDNYFAIFMQPAVGNKSDNINTRFGKRMPFIMAGMPLASIFIILLANYTSFPMLILFLVLTNLCMSIFRSPVISLMPDITYKENRSKANGIINFMGGIGAVTAYFIGSRLWDIDERFPFYLAAILMFISFIVIFTFIKEKRNVIEYEKAEEKIGLFKSIKSLRERKDALSLLLAICSWFIAYQGVETFFTLYGEKYLHLETSAASFSLTFISLSFLVFAIPAGFVGTKLGKKKTIKIGVFGLIISFGVLSMIKDINSVRIIFIICGFFWAMININSYPFVTDMAKKGQIGTYTGLYYFFSSVAAIISPPLLGFVIDIVGYRYMFVYGTVFFILAYVFISRIKGIDDENIKEKSLNSIKY